MTKSNQFPDRANNPKKTGSNNGRLEHPEGDKVVITPVVRTVSEVTAKKISWLWRNWIPLGAITIIDGDPGQGKSTITLDLAARVTRAWKMPPEGGPLGAEDYADVLLLSAEDDPSVIRARLEAAEADLCRVHILEAMTDGEKEWPASLPWDLEKIETIIQENDVRLVVVDPFMAFLEGNLDAHKDQDVRRCLHQLKNMAQKANCAILLVRHLNKLGHHMAIYRGGGSIGIIGACRSALLVGRHPEKPDFRVLASTKTNLGPTPVSLAYSLKSVGEIANICWQGQVDLTANDILQHPDPKRAKQSEKCADLIREILAEGKMESTALDERLAGAGFSKNAIKEGRKRAKVRASKETFSGKWYCTVEEVGPFPEQCETDIFE